MSTFGYGVYPSVLVDGSGTAYAVPPQAYGVAPQTYAAGPLAPQGFLGGALGSVLGGLGGSAIGGWLGNSGLGRDIGSTVGGIAGGFLPFSVGPGFASGDGQQSTRDILLPQNTLNPEAKATNDFMKGAASGAIKEISSYLEQNSNQRQITDAVLPLIKRALDFYKDRDYQRAFAQAYQAYRALEMVRAANPNLP